MALEITRAVGGRAVAIVSDDAKRKFCQEHGAVAVINRSQFSHWGVMPGTEDAKAYGEWAKGARAFGKAIWDGMGERVSPKLVFDGKVDPYLSHTYVFDDIPECHQLMLENKHPYGNMAVLVNARQPGQGASK